MHMQAFGMQDVGQSKHVSSGMLKGWLVQTHLCTKKVSKIRLA